MQKLVTCGEEKKTEGICWCRLIYSAAMVVRQQESELENSFSLGIKPDVFFLRVKTEMSVGML